MSRLIFHIDVNSAFLSWESVRRVQNGEPDLRDIPAAIGGDKDKRTGIILAKSIPAKKLGVKTGEPVSMALRKCPSLVLAKADFKLYTQSSAAFMEICREYAPVVEKFSIDECFLDMSGTHLIYPDPIKTAYEIKDKIRDTLGFTVNVGISTNKLLAKMASDFEKPDKVHTLFPEEITQKLWPLPVGDLFTVGSSTAEKLKRSKITTIGQLANQDVKAIQKLVGVKLGYQIHAFANGISNSPVNGEPEEAKGYSISTTLEDDIVTTEAAHSVLIALADSVTARMRAADKTAYCIGVTVRGNDFRNHSHQRKLDFATDITREILQISLELFDELWDQKTPLRLLGISLSDLTAEDFSQTSLFIDEARENAQKLDKTLDQLRNKYGRASIGRASALGSTLEVGRKYQAQIEAQNAETSKKSD